MKPSQVPIVTGMDTATQLKILDLKIDDLVKQVSLVEKEMNDQLIVFQKVNKKNKKKFKYSDEKHLKDSKAREAFQALKFKLNQLQKVRQNLVNKEANAKIIIFRGDKFDNEPEFIDIDLEVDFGIQNSK